MHSVEKLSNNKIKEIQKLHQKKYRDESALFIVEGEKSLEELINSNLDIVNIYSTSENIKGAVVISENDMKKISTTASACEVFTIAKQKKVSIEEVKNCKKIILLDSISDPGNLGTIIRSSAAFDIDAIILFGNCVELYSPKVIRSCTGNFFKTPIVCVKSVEELNKYFEKHIKVATALSKENNISIKDCSNFDKYIVMFGSEANGLNPELIKITDKNIRLNMSKDVESLNLAVSASIIMYEIFNC